MNAAPVAPPSRHTQSGRYLRSISTVALTARANSGTFGPVRLVATFQGAGHDSTALGVLTGLGFDFGAPFEATTMLLDTFDGRLHRAGVRLQLTQSDRAELELSDKDQTSPPVLVDAPPRVSDDLPPGPTHSRVGDLIGVRVLLPKLRVSARRTRGQKRNSSGEVVAVADIYDRIRVLDRPNAQPMEPTVEIRSVVGHTKQAHRAQAALRKRGLAEQDTDVWTLCASAAGVDLAGFVSTATVALDPQMAAVDGFRLVLANLAATVDANWQGTIDQSDPEFLHDLRIAVRRTRTVLAAAKRVLPSAVLEPARRDFAWLAGLTGAPRDLDVYLLEWSRYIDPLGIEVAPLLEPVRKVLECRRADAHVEMEQSLRSERAAGLMNSWQAWLADATATDALPRRAKRPLGPLVAKLITHAHEMLLERGRLIGPATAAEQLHDLRKDAKKLRYLLECFGDLLHDGARNKYVKRLKALQDNLGEHQDAEVHVDLLLGVARELEHAGAAAATMTAIGQLTERLDQQRLAARIDFAERFARYDRASNQRSFEAMLKGLSR